MRQRVTVTRKVVIEVDVPTVYEILYAAADARRAHPGIDLDITVETLLPEPQRRVVICPDEFDGAQCMLDADFESDEEREELIVQIDLHGVYGFVCEQRDTERGKWQQVDSCWGFLGDHGLERAIREHLAPEFRNAPMISEHDARNEDAEESHNG